MITLFDTLKKIRLKNFPFALTILGIVLFTVSCDTGVDAVDDLESVTVSGQVFEEETSESDQSQNIGKSAESSTVALAAVEGAVVTAVAVHADGSVSTLEGETTTDASGAFTLTAEGESLDGHIRVIANGDGGFTTSAIAQLNGQSTINTRSLTPRSHAEAEVYIEAKSHDDFNSHVEGVTAADVSAYINYDVAAGINSGAQSASELGMAIANAVKAQIEYNEIAEAGASMNTIAEARTSAYTQLQSSLAAAADVEARTSAYGTFEEAYVTVFTANGVDIETQAEFHQTSSSIMIEAGSETGGDVGLGLRKQAELIAAKATALAIEARFEAEGASEATLENLADARAELVTEIRAASSTEFIAEAKENYKAAVDAETEATFNISGEVRTAAETEVRSTVETLHSTIASLSIFVSDIAVATAEAFDDFYAEARVDATASLEAEGVAEADAEAAAHLVVMATLFNES